MNNFTKSVVYSGVVLAAGLVAIFAIQNNMTGTQTELPLTAIEPAAGTEGDYTLGGQSFVPVLEQMSEDAAEAVETVAEDAKAEMDTIAEDITEETSAALEGIDAGVMEAGESIQDALQDIMPAAGGAAVEGQTAE